MKGEVLHYDDEQGTGQISGVDGIRYSFTRGDLKQLKPISKGSKVDFDFDGKQAKDIYLDETSQPAMAAAQPGMAGQPAMAPYNGAIEPDIGLWGYFVRAYTAKFAKFSGRARRKEYWGVVLFDVIIYVVLYGIIGAGFAQVGDYSALSNPTALVQAMGSSPLILIGGGLLIIWGLISILPGLGLMARRLHDIGQSGWWLLAIVIVGVIPYLGFISAIAVLVIALIKGQPGENKFGPPVTPAA
jgi:uncharacterized membrane protein YhaH (DUF805 family)